MRPSLAPRSLSLRLALWFALVSATLLGAIGVYLYQSLASELAWRDDIALAGRIERMRALVDDSASIEALRRRPQLYANMLGNRDNALWMLDDQGHLLIDVNPGGLPLPSLPAAPTIRLTDVDAAQAARLAWVDVWQGSHRFTLVAGKILAERERMLASYRVTLAAALAGGALLSFVLGWMISQRALLPVRTMAERAAAVDVRRLQQKVAVRLTPARVQEVQELQQLGAALDQMLRRLADGFVQLSRFSEDMAHEMRTPLHNLMGHTEHALRKRRGADEYEQLLASNLEEYERLARMIDSMLFLARSEQPASSVTRETIDLAGLCTQLADYFDGVAQERGITVVVHAAGELVADRALVRRALANLLANALRYGDAAGTVTLNTCVDGETVSIAVHNTGAPISAAHLPHLFERFYRCDPARSQGGDSGGLGLAIVASIMHLHGGEARAESGDVGNRFILSFPQSIGYRSCTT
jgi:two-component system, OmpR family, heavy metal sensor histidine kinase CusS